MTWLRFGTAVIGLLALPVAAQEFRLTPDVGFYIGAGVGHATLESELLDTLNAQGAATEDSDIAYKLFSGYHFTPYFAFESSYVDFGKYTADHDDGSLDLDIDGFGFSFIGKLPVASFSLYTKLGLFAWEAELRHAGLDRRRNPSIETYAGDGTSPFYGAGLEYRMNQWLLRGEYERYDLDSDEAELPIDLVSASIGYRF